MFDFASIVSALQTVSTVSSIIGTGVKAYGAAKEATADKQALEFNAAEYERNRQFAEFEAQDAIERGKVTEQRARIATRQLLGEQRARTAANNISVNTGSAVAIQAETAMLGELDALTIRENAAREARGLRQDAANFGGQARLTRDSAGNISPFLSAAPSIMTGASTVADQWLRYRNG